MDTFKAVMLPLAVLCLAVAVVLPPPNRSARWVLAGAAVVLAAVALFVAADAAS